MIDEIASSFEGGGHPVASRPSACAKPRAHERVDPATVLAMVRQLIGASQAVAGRQPNTVPGVWAAPMMAISPSVWFSEGYRLDGRVHAADASQ